MPSGRYTEGIERLAGAAELAIPSISTAMCSPHSGIIHFTIASVAGSHAAGHPPTWRPTPSRHVVVGPREGAAHQPDTLRDVNWPGEDTIDHALRRLARGVRQGALTRRRSRRG